MKTKKGKQRNQADTLYAKKTRVIVKKVNPFEVHQSRDKFDVLNQRTHHSRGLPLVSRQVAIDNRKKTLGVEFKLKNKSNVFQDYRKSGFVRQPKESIYNLNDSEVLTHGGLTLSDIQRFDDVAPEEDDMSDEETRLDRRFTEAAHFGGGDDDDRRDRKTVIEEMIAESKKRKVERTRDHEEIIGMTAQLDSDWKELIPVVKKLHRDAPEDTVQDAYDRLVKEMIFAPRGEPTEKLKNEEDVARIEKERLQKLERDRLKRMKGDQDEDKNQPKQNYRSADDLDDGYFLEPVLDSMEDYDKTLSYPINPEQDDGPSGDEGGESDDEATVANGNNSNELNSKKELEQEDDSNEEDDDESGSEEESEADSLDDLKADDSADEKEEEEEKPQMSSKVLKISTDDDEKEKPSKSKEPQPIEKGLSKKHAKALEKIPFTIEMPESFEHLMELLQKQPVKLQGIIIDRIIKTNHLRLLQVNRNKMLKLFAYLLQYVNDLFSSVSEENISKNFKILSELSPFMFDLIQMNPEDGSKCFLEVIKEKYEDYKKSQKRFPSLDTLVFFKLIGSFFPTSDFRHPIVTPAYIFLHHILSQAKVKSRSDFASGLFLATIVLDHQQLSKKFLPSIMNFLSGLCYIGVKTSMMERMKPVPPFKKNDSLLVLEKKFEGDFTTTTAKLNAEDFLDTPIDDDFKVRALNLTVNLIKDYVKLYDEHVGMKYLLDPLENILARLVDQKTLPESLKELVKTTIDEFQTIRKDKKFKYPELEKKITPMIRLLEPRFETVVSSRREMFSQAEGAKLEQQKLKHMVKREFKSAKRELRRDNEFLSKIKHKRRQDLDRERKDKVKRIFNEASVQQSEYNALSRTKGRRGKF